jgi:hypothetical protein
MCVIWKTRVMHVDVSIDGLTLLYLPNLSPTSYTLAKNDGLPSWFVVHYVVYNWTFCWSCWGDEECDGNHSTRIFSRDINLSFWCSYGMSWSASGGTCWVS